MHYRSSFLAAFALLAACGSAPPTEGLRAAVLAVGPDSRAEDASILRIRSLDELRRAWNHHTGRAVDAPLDAPEAISRVDFATSEVLAIFGGEGFNSSGIQIVEATDEGDVRRVRYESLSFQTMSTRDDDESGGAVPAWEFGFFLLPKTQQDLLVEENVQSMIGEPPVWKLRARL